MIWEVDEDCDQGLTWSEFQAMYHRCNNDKTGRQLLCCLDCAVRRWCLHAALLVPQANCRALGLRMAWLCKQ